MKKIVNEVIDCIKTIQPGVIVQAQEVTKNNGIVLTGISIRPENSSIAPTVYIDQFIENGWSAEDIARYVVNVYRENCNHGMDDVVSILGDYNAVKGHLSLQLVNWGRNQQLWKKIPYTPFLDLAVVVIVNLSMVGNSQAATKVTYEMLEMWGKTFNEVYDDAMINFQKEVTEIISIADVLKISGCPEIPDEVMPQMYVLSNKTKIYGAAHMLDEKKLKDFAEKIGKDLIVLPSSIHEVILVPMCDDVRMAELNSMVQEINETQLLPEEYLSDHNYVYRRVGGWYN